MKRILTLIVLLPFFLFAESETVKGAKADFEKTRVELKEKMKQVNEQIDAAEKSAKEKGSEMKEKTVKELHETGEKISKQIDQLKDDSQKTWKKAKSDLAKSIDELAKKAQKVLKD